jgi:hypothetical protein
VLNALGPPPLTHIVSSTSVHMKGIRFTIAVCLGVALIASIVLLPAYFHDRVRWDLTSTTDALRKSFNQIREASESFSRDHKGRGSPLPATVSLRDLAAAGYFPSGEAKAFKRHEVLVTIIGSGETGMAAVVTTKAASERPLARTELGNGYGLTLFLDGSVLSHSTRLTNRSSQ